MPEKNFSNKQKSLILNKIFKKMNKNYEILTKLKENRDADSILDNLNSF